MNNKGIFEWPKELSDYEIEIHVQKALQWDVLLDDALIDADVKGGRVTLSGTVHRA